MTPKLKKIIITIIILAILFVVYSIFIKPDPEATTLVDGRTTTTKKTSIAQEDSKALGNQIAQALLRIEQISLDKAIFSSDIYKSLKDRSQPITSEPIGRTNPFAPLGDVSTIKSTTRSTTTPPTTTKATSTQPISN